MWSKQDWIESLRRIVIPRLGIIAHALEELTGREYYVRGETHVRQFVGRVPMAQEAFESVLEDESFHRNPLASLKSRQDGEIEEGSWRKINIDKQPEKQLHVVLYDGSKIDTAEPEHTYVYAHIEYRWDVHPIKHYRGHELNAAEGVKMMKTILNDRGVSYEPIRP